jgi:hypothetical protein
MNADEAEKLTSAHGQQIDREIDRREGLAAELQAQDEQHALNQWQDVFTPAELDVAMNEVKKFVAAHPSFRGDVEENRNLLLQELRNRKQHCTAGNLESVYRDLQFCGVFAAPPKPVQSADAYLEEHPELLEKRVPALIAQQAEQALNTFVSTHPQYLANERNRITMMQWLSGVALPITSGNLDAAFDALSRNGQLELSDAVVSSGSTNFVDYGARQPGYPSQPAKWSFREKIAVMTADEIAARCGADPQFKAALDRLDE